MPPNAEIHQNRRFAAELTDLYGEVMGVVPARVETHLDDHLATAILFGSSTPAEESLSQRPHGARMLHDYHEACAQQLFGPIAVLTERLLGKRLLNVILESAPPTQHKILVLVLAPDLRPGGPTRSNEGDDT